MIKFFRKIRQKLLTENKFSKYLIYAIGEIVLVVIGILIALQINNWSEQQKEKTKMSAYLSNLVEDMKENNRNFDVNINKQVFRYYSLQYLYQLSGRRSFELSKDRQDIRSFSRNSVWKKPLPKEYDKVFIEQIFIWSTRLGNQEFIQSTLEEMKSTGSFSLLDEQLKNAINNYHTEWKWRLGPDNCKTSSMYVEK